MRLRAPDSVLKKSLSLLSLHIKRWKCYLIAVVFSGATGAIAAHFGARRQSAPRTRALADLEKLKRADRELEAAKAALRRVHDEMEVRAHEPTSDEYLARQETGERQRREQALAVSETRYRRLFEAAQDGILLLDAETAQITDVNPFLIELLGYSRDQLLAKRLWDVGLFQDISACQDTFLRLQETGYIRYEDLPLKTNEGRSIQVEFVSNVYLVGSKKVIQCNIRDVTERKRAEDKVRELNRELEQRVEKRTAELAASNEKMEAFTYSTAHDLRAPLRHMHGFAELLRNGAQGKLDEPELGYLEIIIASAKRMGLLIDNLLRLSHWGEVAMNPGIVNVAQLFEDIRSALEADLAGRHVTWSAGDLPTIYADPILLRVVLTNLLDNALKFSRGREESIIEIGSRRENGIVTIFVRDNGVGFEMRYVDKLFQTFQRLHRDDEFEGTGIGLASVRRIIERHEGTVWAESALGKGATFFFSLPDTGVTHE